MASKPADAERLTLPVSRHGCVSRTDTTRSLLAGDGAIEAAIRNITVSTWSHPVGTCAMMPKEHAGVLDPQLRVYGIKGLSVVDVSMMPIIPATHTSAPVYAVAEKAQQDVFTNMYLPNELHLAERSTPVGQIEYNSMNCLINKMPFMTRKVWWETKFEL
ncbi:MAG: hypothetical protein Q9185_004092 [Variospora sp. 1 TL-2023]